MTTSTCAVSKLPITLGTPVRALLLTQNPYHLNGSGCVYPYDMWVPRTLVARAVYGDYDRIKPQDDWAIQSWLQGFQYDLLEKEIGENTYHEISVKLKSLNYQTLERAIHEGRLEISRLGKPVLLNEDLEYEKSLDLCIPTVNRVKEALHTHNLYVSGDHQANYFIVNEPQRGLIRARWERWGGSGEDSLAALTAAKKAFDEMGWSSMVLSDAQILIGCPFGAQLYGQGPVWETREPEEHLFVNKALIREDIWQELTQDFLGKPKLTLQDYKNGIQKLWANVLSSEELSLQIRYAERHPEIEKWEPYSRAFYSVAAHDFETPGSSVFEGMPKMLTPESHIAMLMEQDPALSEDLLINLAETAMVFDNLRHINHMWYPSYRVGPSYPYPVSVRRFQQMIRKAAKNIK